MKTIEAFPASCRSSIRAIAERLNTDYETAYAMMCLEAILWDLYPSDDVIVSMIFRNADKQDVGQVQH